MTSLVRKAQILLLVAIVAGAVYNAWFFYSRWSDKRESERQAKIKESEDAQKTIDALGGGRLKILNFYANPGIIRRGGHANICYGVYGAKSVRMEPPDRSLRPAVAHCFEVSPAKTTEYKLVAEDGSGHTTTERFTLRVEP